MCVQHVHVCMYVQHVSVYMDVQHVHVYGCATCMCLVPMETRKNVRSNATEVIGGYEPPLGF